MDFLKNIPQSSPSFIFISEIIKSCEEGPEGLLELKEGDTKEDVKKQFLSLSLKLHPDKNPNHTDVFKELFQLLSYARDITNLRRD